MFSASSVCEYDIIAFTETWLTSDFNSSEYFPDCYVVHRSDRNFDVTGGSRGGGVLLAILDKYKVVELDTSMVSSALPAIDILGCEVSGVFDTLYVYIVYMPPGLPLGDVRCFFELFEQCIILKGNVIILGDFNIPGWSAPEVHDGQSLLLSTFLAFTGLSQCSDVVNQHGHLLDLVISDKSLNISRESIPLLFEGPHHPALSFEIDLNKSHFTNFNCREVSKRYNFKKANLQGLYQAITATDWSFLDNVDDINIACARFYERIYFLFDLYVPLFKPGRRVFPSWFTAELIALIRRKNVAHRKYRRSGDNMDYLEFQQLRSAVKFCSRRDYRQFIRQTETEICSDPKKFWSFVNRKSASTRIGGVIRDDTGLVYDTPQGIVNSFARYFSGVYKRYPNQVIHNSLNPPSIDINCLTENDVFRCLRMLKPSMTSGPDLIPSFFLKDCGEVLVTPLVKLFNLSLSSRSFPFIWMDAKVTPILKSGDAQLVSNYRPVSVLNNFAKVFEMSLYARIFPLVKDTITEVQHGFFEGRSTTTNLTYFTQFVSQALDSNSQVDVVYTDFSKAFDRISHSIILSKLSTFGFSQRMIEFFASYLSARRYSVHFGGCQSLYYMGTSGVPQGSNLGPLLFSLFINDVVDSIDCNKLIFADDLKIFSVINSVEDCLFVQQQLDALCKWCEVNKLCLNVEKCRSMTFTRKLKAIIYPYSLDNTPLVRSELVKDLGVYFDSSLSFKQHVESTVQSAFKTLGFIIRSSDGFCNLTTLKLLYFVFVRSRLEYGSVVWAPYYNLHKLLLERVQRKFLKFLYFKSHGVYPVQGYEDALLLEEFQMSSLENRRICHSLVFLHKLVNGVVDCPSLLQFVEFYVPQATRLDHVFRCPQPRTNVMLKSPVYVMMSNWNQIASVCDIFNCSITEIRRVASRLL